MLTHGRILTCAEACKLSLTGDLTEDTLAVRNLSSADVRKHLETGQDIASLVKTLVQEAGISFQSVQTARSLICRRMSYLSKKGLLVPEIPDSKTLLQQLQAA